MPKSITIYTDYVCPYCLLAEAVISEVAQGEDIAINWHPFELRPYPAPTLRVEDRYLPDIWKRSVYPMAEQLGVNIKLPDISPQPRTDKAFEVFAMAEEKGVGHAFSMEALKAFFQEEKDIGDHEVLASLGEGAGLNRADVLEALAEGRYRERHQAAQKHAVEEAKISSVPTIMVGNKTFTGVPNPSDLRKALNDLEHEST